MAIELQVSDKNIDTIPIINLLSQIEKPVEPQPEEYPPYMMGHWYYAGDKVTFEGKRYICIAPKGAVCVWSPKDYPAYWEEAVGV